MRRDSHLSRGPKSIVLAWPEIKLGVGLFFWFLVNPVHAALSPECQVSYAKFVKQYDAPGVSFFDELQDMCQNLSQGELIDKINSCKDPLKFTRSFVAQYHKLLDELPGHKERLGSLARFEGRAGNDVHLEQFKVTVDGDGKPITVMSDVDDWERGPLYQDILRLMTTARLHDTEASIRKVFDAYLQGVKGEPMEPPKVVREMLKRAKKQGLKAKENAWNPKTGKLVMEEDMSPLDPGQRKKIESAVREAYGDGAKVLDAAFRARVGGGSGGLDRYLVLIEPPPRFVRGPKEDIWVIEFKEQIGSAAKRPGQTRMNELERLRDGIQSTYSGHPPSTFRFQDFEGKPFIFRPKLEADEGFDVKALSFSDRQETLQWEAYTHGRMHSSTADDPSAYAAALENFGRDKMAEEAKLIRKVIETLKEKKLRTPATPGS